MKLPYSHPDKDLKTHLEEVNNRYKKLSSERINNFSRLLKIISLSHDIGKSTKWFQKEIRGKSFNKSESWTYHSEIGALASYYCVQENGGMTDRQSILSFIIVSSHHSNLPNVEDYLEKKIVHSLPDEKRMNRIRQMINNMNQEYKEFCREIFREMNVNWDDFLEFIEKDVYKEIYLSMDNMERANFYEDILELWSSLILSDKTSAADIKENNLLSYDMPEKEKMEEHISKLEKPKENIKKELNNLRERARQDIIKKSQEKSRNLKKLSLPTGFGKTYTGISYALRRAEKKKGRVIYALPFTSIIDQVDEEIQDIFNLSLDSDKYTIHNHLSESVNAFDNKEESTDEYSREEYMIGESWKSGFILTTFTQLFESLSSPNNSQSMKLPRLENSIILLDEPQAISLKWWNIIRNHIIPLLTNHYNCEVILMTATQPSILNEGEQLVKNKNQYFNFLKENSRVEYTIHNSLYNYINNGSGDNHIDYSSASEILKQEKCSTMAICNTINSSEKLYDKLSKEMNNYVNLNKVYCEKSEKEVYGSIEENVVEEIIKKDKEVLAFLSSRIRPKDREKIISCIKDVLGQKTVKLVTTQLVEAGVDISFKKVYRDFCPIPSIVQAAGRCNRSYNSDQGKVTVWLLREEDRKPPSYYVYSMGAEENLLEITRKVLKNENKINEKKMVKDLVEDYYNKLREKEPGRKGLSNKITNLEFDDLNKKSFIDDGGRKSIDIIICRTQKEKEKGEEILQTEDTDKIISLVNNMKKERISLRYNSEKDIDKLLRYCDLIKPLDNIYLLKENKCIHKSKGLEIPNSSVNARFIS